MDPVKAVATIEGKDVEVELKAPPGYIAESEFATRFQDKLEKRVESITKNRREELVNDEVRSKHLHKREIDPKPSPATRRATTRSRLSSWRGRRRSRPRST